MHAVASEKSAAETDSLFSTLAFMTVAFLPFQNSPLAKLGFGSFGENLSVIPLLMLAALWMVRIFARPDSMVVGRWALVVLAYVGAVTLFGLLHFDWEYRGVSLLNKSVFAMAHWAILAIGVSVGYIIPRDTLRVAVRLAITINAFGYLLHEFVFHSADKHVIAFSSEPSHFGVLTVCLGMLGASLATSSRERYLILLTTLALILGSGSKGALACLALASVAMLFLRLPPRGARNLALYAAVLVFASLLIVVSVMRIQAGIQEFTSVATRASGAITALRLGFIYPFGVGLGGFFPAFSEAVPGSWHAITSWLGVSVNLNEAMAFAYTDDRNLSAKAFFLDTLIYFGWPGFIAAVFFMLRLSLRCLRSQHEGALWLAGGLIFASMAMATYYTVTPFHVVPVLVGFALQETSRT